MDEKKHTKLIVERRLGNHALNELQEFLKIKMHLCVRNQKSGHSLWEVVQSLERKRGWGSFDLSIGCVHRVKIYGAEFSSMTFL